MRRLALAIGLAVLAASCGDGARPPTSPTGFPTVGIDLTLALAADVPTFKVDGRLELIWRFADDPVGGRDLGVVVLPADRRRETLEIDVPVRPGQLVAREETFTPSAPFLCGSTDFFDPREMAAATLVLELCQPG